MTFATPYQGNSADRSLAPVPPPYLNGNLLKSDERKHIQANGALSKDAVGETPFAVAYLMRRRAGLTHEEYVRHYKEVHFPLAIKLPSLLRYIQLPVRSFGDFATHGLEGGQENFDSVSIYIFPDEQAFVDLYNSSEAIKLVEDTILFIDESRMISVPLMFMNEYIAPTATAPLPCSPP